MLPFFFLSFRSLCLCFTRYFSLRLLGFFGSLSCSLLCSVFSLPIFFPSPVLLFGSPFIGSGLLLIPRSPSLSWGLGVLVGQKHRQSCYCWTVGGGFPRRLKARRGVREIGLKIGLVVD
ncbi:hypothetical protein NC652_010627 [Populus alba x Populus x berolinensis]|nr:hypothetical protein NC652_010627 [Populus alba x Populus x berolinensis]